MIRMICFVAIAVLPLGCSSVESNSELLTELMAKRPTLRITQVSTGGIEVRRPDGSETSISISESRRPSHGVLTADGRTLVGADGTGVFAIDVITGQSKWALPAQRVDWMLAITPKGDKVAFAAAGQVFVASPDFSKAIAVADGESPSLEATGHFLFYSRNNEIVRLDTWTGLKTVVGPGSEPSVAPNGARIAFRTADDRYAVGTVGETISDVSYLGESVLRKPMWTEDSQFLMVIYDGSLSGRFDWTGDDPKTVTLVRAADGKLAPMFEVYAPNPLLYSWSAAGQ